MESLGKGGNLLTKNWRTFDNHFESSDLGPLKFGQKTPFRVQKELSLYLCKYTKSKFLVLNSYYTFYEGTYMIL